MNFKIVLGILFILGIGGGYLYSTKEKTPKQAEEKSRDKWEKIAEKPASEMKKSTKIETPKVSKAIEKKKVMEPELKEDEEEILKLSSNQSSRQIRQILKNYSKPLDESFFKEVTPFFEKELPENTSPHHPEEMKLLVSRLTILEEIERLERSNTISPKLKGKVQSIYFNFYKKAKVDSVKRQAVRNVLLSTNISQKNKKELYKKIDPDTLHIASLSKQEVIELVLEGKR